MKDTIGAFLETLFHSATNAHILHLQTRSYAQHKALDEYYSSIVDLADNYAEAAQGLYGIIENYPGTYAPPAKDPLTELREVGLSVRNMRKNLPKDTELQNIADEIAALIDTTIYKLRFLA